MVATQAEQETDPLSRSELAGFGSSGGGGRAMTVTNMSVATGDSCHIEVHRKRNRWRDTWDREIKG